MSTNLPNFKELQEISEYLNTIETLQNQSKKELKTLKKTKKQNQIYIQEYQKKIEKELKVNLQLNALELKIEELQNQEKLLKEEIKNKLTEVISNFISTGGLKRVVTKIIHFLKENKEEVVILSSIENSRFLPKNQEYQNYNDNILRIEIKQKSFILDPEIIINQTVNHFLTKSLPDSIEA